MLIKRDEATSVGETAVYRAWRVMGLGESQILTRVRLESMWTARKKKERLEMKESEDDGVLCELRESSVNDERTGCTMTKRNKSGFVEVNERCQRTITNAGGEGKEIWRAERKRRGGGGKSEE
jgi:hypothetical protein